MAAAKVKVGDTVLVRAGKDKGLRGTVLKVDRENDRVIVEGVNRVQRHQKAMPGAGSQNQVGGIITREAPIHISNVTRVEAEKKADKKADKADKKADKAAKKAEKADKADTAEAKADKASAEAEKDES
jgi:large subunit ribosomal protein L24